MTYQILFNGSPFDPVASGLKRMNERPCTYAPRDPATCEIVFERLKSAAQRNRLLTYAELVRGVTFMVPGEGGELRSHVIDVGFLRGQDEAIIQDFGRYIGAATYRDSQVLLNALLVPNSRSQRPADAFFNWASSVGRPVGVPTEREWQADAWHRELKRVYAAYAVAPAAS
jgi:hypothetical protein